MKSLKSIAGMTLCLIAGFIFVGCSSDDGGSANDSNLGQIVVGAWAQDGDNDIFVVNADGTGVGYDNPSNYRNDRADYSFIWSYSDGWVNVIIDMDGELQVEKMRAKSVSQNKIIWQRYAIETDDYDPSTDDWDGHDAFGYYDLWVWERYTK